MKYSNPLVGGWYADPEARSYNNKYYIYVTNSFSQYDKQVNIDCFETEDFVSFKQYADIIKIDQFPEFEKACWAPTELKVGEYHYLVFAINDIQSNDETGGLCIARSKNPEGPYERFTDNLLIDKFINGAQPIDAHLFADGKDTYLYYGGWRHLNVVKMASDMKSICIETLKEIKVQEYVEAPCVFKRNGLYHIMYSSGNWTDDSYKVLSGTSSSVYGPFENIHTILEADEVAGGPGHNGYLVIDNQYYNVYHRRYHNDKRKGNRYIAMDKMNFENEYLLPIKMT